MKAIAVAILALMLSACGGGSPSPSPEPKTETITGTFTLHHERGWAGDTCRGDDGYSDIKSGMQVTLRDGEGTVLATDTFAPGRTIDGLRCVFDFEFADVPPADFYVIDAGRRGEVTYSRDEMEQNDWSVALEIGA